MNSAQAISKIYENRKNFILIGLTGRTGSGCSIAATIFSKSISELKLPIPELRNKAEERKYCICHNFLKKNWPTFKIIQISNIITSFIVENDFESFEKYVVKLSDNNKNISDLSSIKEEYERIFSFRQKINKQKDDVNLKEERRANSYEFYFEEMPKFTILLKDTLTKLSEELYTKVYQSIGDNLRKSGRALDIEYNPDQIFRISVRINKIIKLLRKLNGEKQTCIVIDAMRNPYEALFFRERYAAFYLVSINALDQDRISRLQTKFNLNNKQIKEIDDKEYPKKLNGDAFFTSQNIQQCIELADIHLNNNTVGQEDYSFLKKQIAKIIALILHPGIITPSHEERCMQIAYNSRLNSGCMSRQVGALVCDLDYNIKSIGWNCVPKGQVSCSMRSVNDLINNEDKEAFSDYENNNFEFREKLKELYASKVDSVEVKEKLNGLNLGFCFKKVKNRLDENDNQVHTRALHAEENSFIQITKNGGVGVNGGILFTTASPCELCSKKVYQIGISKIIYIDPYPGIAVDHILGSGSNRPELKLFSGAIGRAYTQLYEPILPLKDELNFITN